MIVTNDSHKNYEFSKPCPLKLSLLKY